jgi:precorrin-6Y C5,15-methyltransferase (decarboxylating)
VLVGAGTGSPDLLTGEGRQALARCECVIGAERVLGVHEKFLGAKPRKALFEAEKIAAFIEESLYARFCVLLSGDGGFYSLAKTLSPVIRHKGWQFRVLPGISSLALLAARLGISWEDIKTISLHGKNENAENTENVIVGGVTRNRRTFFLTGGKTGPAEICGILAARGLGSLDVVVGENLSLPGEALRRDKAAAFVSAAFAPLSVALVENPAPLDDSAKNAGLRDSVFIRGEVPMTKGEIRLLAVARLRLGGADIVWDIGAGTGSVSCAAALQAGYGRVYAVERDERALRLIRQNRDALGLRNIEIVPGCAPEALEGLPVPDGVFIGGTGGRLGAILDAVFARNPVCGIVLTAISLETLAEAVSCLRRFSGEEPEIIQVAVSRAVKAGNHHLLKAENPVFIVSFKGGGG